MGNTINLLDDSNEMFGKIMSLNDDLIIRYFTLLTRVDMESINSYQRKIEKGENPRDIKIKLAHEVVAFYHSEEEADKAEKYFIETFSNKETPSDILEFSPEKYDIVSVLKESGLVNSSSEARRVLSQKGVKVNGKIIEDLDYIVEKQSVVQKGKIKFLKII